MSGIEIAGLVLGAFPIIVKCLDNYQKGFEPLEEWWHFRAQFIAFVDGINHQMMRYHQNMIELLDPIVPDTESLQQLVNDAADPRWHDGSLAPALESRLATEYPRFLRIVERMEELVKDLEKLLQIKDGDATWIGTSESRPWEWHFRRMQVAFSKGKYKKVKKLDVHNTELKDILKYSNRVIPISDSRKISPPVALLDKIRQHALNVHNAIKRSWTCNPAHCQTHQASLGLISMPKTAHVEIMFTIKHASSPDWITREVTFERVESTAAATIQLNLPISHVRPAEKFVKVQTQVAATESKKKFRTQLKAIFRSSTTTTASSRSHSPVVPTVQIQAPSNSSSVNTLVPPNIPRIVRLCKELENEDKASLGSIEDDYDRAYQILKSTTPRTSHTPISARLIPLDQILSLHHRSEITVPRNIRFKMCANIASALLQAHQSPWLSSGCSKRDFCFLADSNGVHDSRPFVPRCFMPTSTSVCSSEPSDFDLSTDESTTRAALFSTGIILLELIFGLCIEDCALRSHYLGANNQPNDHTDYATAKKWATRVAGECGEEIADVVRRCLDCAFGPRPGLRNKEFREAVYLGVVKPLVEWDQVLPVVVP